MLVWAGRYDPAYEKGLDYPLAFVRWTEERNLAIFSNFEDKLSTRLGEQQLNEDSAQAYDYVMREGSALGYCCDIRIAQLELHSTAG